MNDTGRTEGPEPTSGTRHEVVREEVVRDAPIDRDQRARELRDQRDRELRDLRERDRAYGDGRDYRGRRDGGRTPALIFGILLFAAGLYFLARNTLGIRMPDLDWDTIWPFLLVALGLLLLYRAWERRPAD